MKGTNMTQNESAYPVLVDGLEAIDVADKVRSIARAKGKLDNAVNRAKELLAVSAHTDRAGVTFLTSATSAIIAAEKLVAAPTLELAGEFWEGMRNVDWAAYRARI